VTSRVYEAIRSLVLAQFVGAPRPLSDGRHGGPQRAGPKNWTYVRSFVIKSGHLFLSLMANGGTYEFAPWRRRAEGALERSV
jgi:hypothetical protein